MPVQKTGWKGAAEERNFSLEKQSHSHVKHNVAAERERREIDRERER